MAFQRLQIRYQTARSLPSPYAYFYTLTAQTTGSGSLQVDLAITYPDRDDIDDDELMAEGFTREDDLTWSGQLPKSWTDAMTDLSRKTRLQPLDEDALGEGDDFWEITLEISSRDKKQGIPKNASEWHYTVQELMQAVYERLNRERPFVLIYVDSRTSESSSERHVSASFAERTVRVVYRQNQHESSHTLPWSALQPIMSKVYEHDFDPDKTLLKRPTRAGQWLNLGSEEWYEVSSFKALTRLLSELDT